jgi:hypothetical protein
MRLLLVAVASAAFGCAQRPLAHAEADPTGTPPEPVAACTVRQRHFGEVTPPGLYVHPVAPELRFDARGRLLFAVDQREYAGVRRSWFSYDARERLVHVHRRVDRVELPSAIHPICDEGPCPPPPRNDHDGSDEDYRYDEHDRPVQSVERVTRFDHQGDGFRPFHVRTRTVELRYPPGTPDALPTSAHVLATERWTADGRAPGREQRPSDEVSIVYAYESAPRVVTRFLVQDGARSPDRRIERDDRGRAVHETRFADGSVWYEIAHRHDDAGRRVETIRTERARGAAGRTVTTYTYDPPGRLSEVRTTLPADGWTFGSTYEYGAGCTRIHRVDEEGPGIRDPIDLIEQALVR